MIGSVGEYYRPFPSPVYGSLSQSLSTTLTGVSGRLVGFSKRDKVLSVLEVSLLAIQVRLIYLLLFLVLVFICGKIKP